MNAPSRQPLEASPQPHRLAGQRVLVTGATGYIGGALAPKLVEWGAIVTCTTRSQDHPDLGSVRWQPFDLEGPLEQMIACCEGHDIVIHLAALRGQTDRPLDQVRRINVDGTQKLLQAATRSGVRELVYVSTVGVAGFGENIDEQTPYARHENPYHQTKAEAERLVLGDSGFERTVIIRPCIVYGEARTDGFVVNLARMIHKGVFVPIGLRSPHLEMVYIDNLLDGFRTVLERGRDGETYIVTDGAALRVRTIAQIIAETLGRRVPPLPVPVVAAHLGAFAFERAAKLVGRSPFITTDKLRLFTQPQTFDIGKVRALGYVPLVEPELALRRTVAALAKRLP